MPTPRTAGVKVVGLKAGRLATSYLDGLGRPRRRSACCRRASRSRCGAPAARPRTPLVGDWDGDGDDDPGWWRNGQVALRMTSKAGAWVKRFRYGTAGDVPVVGDWDGDGRDDLGVFRAGTWLLRTGQSGGTPDQDGCASAAPATVPVVGSWSGTRTGIGVRRGRTWLLRSTATAGRATRTFRFGKVGDVPVVGTGTAAGATASGSSATVSGCSATDGRPARPATSSRSASRAAPAARSSATGTATAPTPRRSAAVTSLSSGRASRLPTRRRAP